MKAERLRAGEKELARWSAYTGNEKDSSDLELLENNQSGLLSTAVSQRTPGNGLILRRGGEPIGYALWSVVERNDFGTLLLITRLHILKEERSPGVASKLIQELRTQAQSKNAAGIAWYGESPIIRRIGEKIATRYKKEGISIISIEKLDKPTLADALQTKREARKNQSSDRYYV